MKFIFKILLIFISSTGYGLCYEGTPEKQIEAFFDELKTGEVESALTNLYSSNPLIGTKSQELLLMKQQIEGATTFFGKYVGYEKIRYEKLSDSLIVAVYLAKYENHPMSWEFFFYKPNNKWIISAGRFGDRFQYID